MSYLLTDFFYYSSECSVCFCVCCMTFIFHSFFFKAKYGITSVSYTHLVSTELIFFEKLNIENVKC